MSRRDYWITILRFLRFIQFWTTWTTQLQWSSFQSWRGGHLIILSSCLLHKLIKGILWCKLLLSSFFFFLPLSFFFICFFWDTLSVWPEPEVSLLDFWGVYSACFTGVISLKALQKRGLPRNFCLQSAKVIFFKAAWISAVLKLAFILADSFLSSLSISTSLSLIFLLTCSFKNCTTSSSFS